MPPTQRDLARHLGLSPSTISLALRNSPLIPLETRMRVQQGAVAIGYRPNPMVTTLMSHVRTARPVPNAGCLGIVVDFPSLEEWLAFHPAYVQQFEAIRHRAELHGYRTECFFLRTPGMTPATLDRILYARGIVSLIFAAPRKEPSCALNLQWERYCCVKSGYTWEDLKVDGVAANNRQHVEMAFRELARSGFQRIGVCLNQEMTIRADYGWVAGYLVAQTRASPENQIPMFIRSGHGDHDRFAQWISQWKPDAIFGSKEMLHLIETLPEPRPAFVCHFDYPGLSVPAIEENNPTIGEVLVDQLLEKSHRNERGLPAHPRLVLIDGDWCNRFAPGETRMGGMEVTG